MIFLSRAAVRILLQYTPNSLLNIGVTHQRLKPLGSLTESNVLKSDSLLVRGLSCGAFF